MTGIVRCKCTFIALVLIAHLMPCVSHAEQPERVRVTAKQLFEALDLSRPGLRDVAEAVKKHDFSAAATAWTVYFRNREKPTLHFDRRVWAEFMQREFPQVAEAIVDKARRLAEGDISHGTIRFPVDGPLPGATIDWFHNPKRDTNYVSLVGSQWFLNPLGRAYLLTGNERYARAFAWVFESWFDHQEQIVQGQGGLGFEPIYRAYYPGIQTRILADNYYCLARSDALTPAVSLKIMRQLVANARFLANQERSYRRGNQQVAAVLGLGVVGLFLPELKQAPQWLQRAESLMIEHLEKDFYDDGGNKEIFTQYHKTCLRDIGYVALMSECNGRPSPLLRGRSRQALERIYDWLARLVTPTGQTPPLHSAVFSTDYAIHLLVSATHFKRADHAWLARRFWDRGAVPCQKSPVAHVVYLLAPPLAPSMMQATQPPDYTSVHLDQSGFAILRSGWKMSDRYLVLQYGQANTGHAYPAALSFLLQTNGELIATHPGSPRSYRHPAYSYCKTTRAHNTVTLDGESVTQFGSDTARALLTYLALHPGVPHRRDALAGLLWPEHTDARARHNLRAALSRLRSAIDDREADAPLLEVARQTIQFSDNAHGVVDVLEMRQALAATRAHAHEQLERCDECAELLRTATALYRGEFLAGFSLDRTLRPRVRARDGIDRGAELEAVLDLAEEFPARHTPELDAPIFGRH